MSEVFWGQLPLGPHVQVLGHDQNGLGALEKPAGVLSHPNDQRDGERTLLAGGYDQAGECYHWRSLDGADQRLWLLNRLDSATSGVILVAADGQLAAEVKAQFQRHAVAKSYVALVFGTPRFKRETWRDRLAVERRGGVVRTSAAGRVSAESECRVLQIKTGTPPLALLELTPKTGRTHQLRVQCARRGWAIVGDQTYGNFRQNREFAKATREKRLFLHSRQTDVHYDWAGRSWTFSAQSPLPPEFTTALGNVARAV